MLNLWKSLPWKHKPDPACTKLQTRLKLIEAMLVGVLKGQKQIMATVNEVKAAVVTLGEDVSTEIQAAKDAILRAQAGDPTALDEVLASLNAISTAVKDATTTFNSTN